jgi:transposase-like protein
MPAQRKYPDELRERAVKMVLEIRARDGKGHGELARVGRQLGVHPKTLRGVSSRPRSTAGRGRVLRVRTPSGSRSWNGETVSSAGQVRS